MDHFITHCISQQEHPASLRMSTSNLMALLFLLYLPIVSTQYQEEFEVLQPPNSPSASPVPDLLWPGQESLNSAGFDPNQQRQRQQLQELPKYYTGNATSRQMINGSRANEDVLAELRHCSYKSSRDVVNCQKSYEEDLRHFGPRGPSCCALVKFKKCLDDGLIVPCKKHFDRLVDLYIKDNVTRSLECSHFSYPSLTCITIVNSNSILIAAASTLLVTFCCGFLYLCRCICRCCRCCCGSKSNSSRKSTNQSNA